MATSATRLVPTFAALDDARQLADELCQHLLTIAGIVRSGTELPSSDSRQGVARRLVRWSQDSKSQIEAILPRYKAAVDDIRGDVIEAREGEPFALAWRKGECAFDVLLEFSAHVLAFFRDRPEAVEVGSRLFFDQLESAVRVTSHEVNTLKDEINREYARAKRQIRSTAFTSEPPPRKEKGDTPTKTVRGPKKHVAARMLVLLHDNDLAVGWTAEEWAARLGCASSTVKETATWKDILKVARAQAAREGASKMDRSRVIRNTRHGGGVADAED